LRNSVKDIWDFFEDSELMILRYMKEDFGKQRDVFYTWIGEMEGVSIVEDVNFLQLVYIFYSIFIKC